MNQSHASDVHGQGIYCQGCKLRLLPQENYCSDCNECFEDEEEVQRHFEQSPFHKDEVLECSECMIRFPNQLELHQHLDSKSHALTWVLFVA
jgi:hypothetical protein